MTRAARRQELLKQLETAGRELSAATVMFHTALAARQGLTATEEKALDILDRSGPLTAGELAERSGLAPASVTGLLDGLERKRFARRRPNPRDGRSVLVEIDREKVHAAFLPLFADFVRSLEELYAEHSDEQLELILRFMTEAARRQSLATGELTSGLTDGDRVG